MTAQEYLLLIRRYWKALIAVPLAAAVVSVVVALFAPPLYSASTTMVVSDHAASIGNMTKYVVADREFEELTVSVSASNVSNTITLSVKGPDGESCVRTANELMDTAYENSYAMFPDTRFHRNPAERANDGSPDKVRGAIVAFLSALLIVLAVLFAIDMRRRAVKSAEGLERSFELPLLGSLDSKGGAEQLAANIRLSSDCGAPLRACIVPAANQASALLVGDALTRAGGADAFSRAITVSPEKRTLSGSDYADGDVVICCCPLTESASASYVSREADCTVVSAIQWRDSLRDVEHAVAALRIAGASVTGLVYVDESAFSEAPVDA